MTLTPAQKEAFARANSNTIESWTVELRHPIWAEPIRVCQSHNLSQIETRDFPLEISAPIDGGTTQTFQCLAFTASVPSIGPEPGSSLDIQADGVSGQVLPLISAANKSYTPISATLRSYSVVTTDDLVTPEPLSVYHLQMQNFEATKTSINMSFGYTNGANMSFPSKKYTAESNPGLA